MEDERNTQQHDETAAAADQVPVEVKDRGLLDSLLGRKKHEDKEKKQQEENHHEHEHLHGVVVQKVEDDVKTRPQAPEEEKKGILDKIMEKLLGGHKKPEDVAAAAPAQAPHAEDWMSSPDGKEGKIMDKIPGYTGRMLVTVGLLVLTHTITSNSNRAAPANEAHALLGLVLLLLGVFLIMMSTLAN